MNLVSTKPLDLGPWERTIETQRFVTTMLRGSGQNENSTSCAFMLDTWQLDFSAPIQHRRCFFRSQNPGQTSLTSL